MKNKIFTLVLTLMGSTFLFAQQWTGANNTTGDISRNGKVSIGTTKSDNNLNVQRSIGIYGGLNDYNVDINFYTFLGINTPVHQIAARQLIYPSPWGPGWGNVHTAALYIGSVTNKTFVIS